RGVTGSGEHVLWSLAPAALETTRHGSDAPRPPQRAGLHLRRRGWLLRGHGSPRGQSSVVRQKFVEQIVASTREGAGPTAEAKEGVALGGAHLKMRDDNGPGPSHRASPAK